MTPGRLGVFGGTFDPPHIGHLIVARDVVDALSLDRMLMVPAARPPHKASREDEPSSAALRLEMLAAAVEGDPVLEIDDIELGREGPSYTVDTLEALHERHPGDALHLVIGVDQLAELATWRRPDAVARLARLAVLARAGTDPRAVDPGVKVPFDVVPATRVDVSSTGIRRRVREGRSIRYLVPDAVRGIIEREGLYAHAASAGGTTGAASRMEGRNA